ncbi:MAG: BspA family leucine-rich repeat surface protein [Bacteroidetes bacterium]|nr:BspA family leucine-rich repeat surface protein [Bacteroidota bacterium]
MTCSALNGPANINTWNTSQAKDMSILFAYDSLFNQPIGNWNTSGVWNMSNMFQFAYTFNQPIGNWNTSQVETFYEMFSYGWHLIRTIGNWNLAKRKPYRECLMVPHPLTKTSATGISQGSLYGFYVCRCKGFLIKL